MKTLTTLFALAILSATASAQTIKALGYDTASGEVVANTGTNVLTFTNGEVTFTKLIVGDPAENATVISDTAVDSSVWEYNGDPVISAEERVLYNANGNLVAEFGDGLSLNAPLSFLNNFGQAATNAAATRTNLGLGATWLTNDNVTNFRTAIGLGATNDVTFQSIDIGEIRFETSLIFELDGATFHTPLAFNDATNAATTRTNLGLPLPALTNTSNVTMMRALAGSTNTNEPFSGTIQFVDGNNVDIYIYVTNGIITGWAD